MVLFGSDALAATGEIVSSTDLAVEFSQWFLAFAGIALLGGLVAKYANPSVSVQEVYALAKTAPLWFYLLLRERVLKISRKDELIRWWEDQQVEIADKAYAEGICKTRAERRFLLWYTGFRSQSPGLMPKIPLSSIIKRRLASGIYRPVFIPGKVPPQTKGGHKLSWLPKISVPWHQSVKREANKMPEYTPPVRSAPVHNELDMIYAGKAA